MLRARPITRSKSGPSRYDCGMCLSLLVRLMVVSSACVRVMHSSGMAACHLQLYPSRCSNESQCGWRWAHALETFKREQHVTMICTQCGETVTQQIYA